MSTACREMGRTGWVGKVKVKEMLRKRTVLRYQASIGIDRCSAGLHSLVLWLTQARWVVAL